VADIGTPISRLPYGVLGLLGIKSQGQMPLYLKSDYQAVLDLLGLFHVNHQTPLAAGGPFTINQAPGVFATPDPVLTVPQNELWYFPEFSASLQIISGAAGITYAAALAVRALTIVRILSPPASFNSSVANPQNIVSNNAAFWLGPGDELGYYPTTTFDVNNATGRMRLHPVRMPL
jgi:hypothetical protein